ncbi:restriction endonuclease subunit S [Clostridium perfringens]|nr:restriction endonuclease subunit S [Clostridium perfringens]
MKKEVREGYKITELGEIPNEWDIIALGEIGEFKNGINKSKEDFGFGCKFVNIQDAYSGNIVKNDLLERINVNDKEKEIYKLENDDIILVRSSVKPEGVGYPILFKKENEDIVYCGFMIRYRYNKRKINPMFLLYQLRSENIRKRVLDLSTVSANTNINQDSYKQIKISIPSVKEQEKIAEILSTVDEQIENIEKLIQKNQELKRGLMQQLLTKGIGHTEFKKTEIGDIPNVWKVVKLSEISAKYKNSIVDGPFGSNLKTDDYTENGVLVMQSSYITNGKFELKDAKYISQDKANELERSKVKAGDILMAKIGANFGMAEIIPKDFQYGILSSNSLKIDLDSDVALNELYIYILKYYKDKKFIDKLASTTAQPALSLKEIKNLKVPLFSINEQKKIALILLKLDEKIEQYKNKKEKIKDIKKGLMQQLFTGSIRVL